MKDCPETRHVSTSTDQSSSMHEQSAREVHEQPPADTQVPPSDTDESFMVTQRPDVPLRPSFDMKDEGWTPCIIEHNDDNYIAQQPSVPSQETSMSVNHPSTVTVEQVETGTVTADTETVTIPPAGR